MSKFKSYTFTLNEISYYNQTGTVTVDATDLDQALEKALGYSNDEHHGDNDIDYNSEKNVSRSIKALVNIDGGTVGDSINDESLLSAMLLGLADNKRSFSKVTVSNKRLVQLSVCGDGELAIISVGKQITDEQIKTAHEEYCTYREVCADADEEEFDDFEDWAATNKPELEVERFSLDEVVVSEFII
jgi:hypothetical protein